MCGPNNNRTGRVGMGVGKGLILKCKHKRPSESAESNGVSGVRIGLGWELVEPGV